MVIDNRDALATISRYGSPHTVHYVDPPYLASTRTGLTGRTGGDYGHDHNTEHHHRQLATVLHACRGHVLLSGYPCPLYQQLYPDWIQLTRLVTRPTTNRRGHAGVPATETIWTNRPAAGNTDLFGGDAA